MNRACATLGRVSIVLWYRSADVEISGRTTYKISTTVGKLLEKQDGGALLEGIHGLSQALMEV
jgi:hypothetical protein